MHSKFFDVIADIARQYIRARFVRTPSSFAITTGLAILALVYGFNVIATIDLNMPWLKIAASVSTAHILLIWETRLIWFALLFIAGGILWSVFATLRQHKLDDEENNRKVAICVHLDAYNAVIPTPLLSVVPVEVKGKRIPITVQKRDALAGGHKIEEVANSVLALQELVIQHGSGRDAADICVFAGGLAPVPLLFLLGNALEDERPTQWADWDRSKATWVLSKNGQRVSPWPMPDLETITEEEVVIQSGITYSIHSDGAGVAFPGKRVLIWEPFEKIFQVVLDEESCVNICNDYKNMLHQLGSKGVKRVHFLLACSTALTMRLGSVTDPRNMPEVTVYQYDKSNPLIYPWGIGVTSHENKKKVLFIDRR